MKAVVLPRQNEQKQAIKTGNTTEFDLLLVRSTYTPLRGYSVVAVLGAASLQVSSHTPLRGYSCYPVLAVKKSLTFQVIPPCGGIRHPNPQTPSRNPVSSHTPLRGYSAKNSFDEMNQFVSSHTPLRGYSLYFA